MSAPAPNTTHDLCHPPREWLLRCSDDAHRPAVCSIAVTDGHLEIWLAEESMISLDGGEIVQFQAAFADAATLATADRARPLTQA
ncbi:hypothetical protein FHS29_006932 [Saccharothrix tamanrassetensis]|uniref:Uncharacterized protein n=1 Tax=Saccharothrix tamanrassetensis TaxID=1051531 RepID=A0A841CSN5_9PSEU|nr:hypothetical protein [Saccharothrix tamanrassetensis]MBB5960309.1 hypothetical protein [Saccharothrix tamanrassetensis]